MDNGLQVFLVGDDKAPEVMDILQKNKQKLLQFFSTFQKDKGKEQRHQRTLSGWIDPKQFGDNAYEEISFIVWIDCDRKSIDSHTFSHFWRNLCVRNPFFCGWNPIGKIATSNLHSLLDA